MLRVHEAPNKWGVSIYFGRSHSSGHQTVFLVYGTKHGAELLTVRLQRDGTNVDEQSNISE